MSRVINSKGKENITINKDCTSVRFDIPSVENVFVSSTVARQNVFFFGGGGESYVWRTHLLLLLSLHNYWGARAPPAPPLATALVSKSMKCPLIC